MTLACNTCAHYRAGALCQSCVDKEEYKPLEGHEDVGSTVERLSEQVRILREALEACAKYFDREDDQNLVEQVNKAIAKAREA